MDKPLGTSATMVPVAGAFKGLVVKARVEENTYFARHLIGESVVDWRMALVITLFAGALMAARMAGSRFVERVPALEKPA